MNSGATRLGMVLQWVVPSVVGLGRRAADCLYILQLERYIPGRFRIWLAGHRGQLLPAREIGIHLGTLSAAALLALAGSPVLGPLAVWYLGGHMLLRRFRSLQVSQRLQWTGRAVRVAIAASALALVLAVVMMGAALGMLPSSWWLFCGLLVLTTIDLGVSALVLLAAAATAPAERCLAGRYLAQAEDRMRRFPGRVVGITGSYGKTSTKYIVADLLGSSYRVFKTPAGVNTTMGITRVIREDLRDDPQYFIVEMSAYGPGEIREVCDLVHPTLGILTAVGVQHLERFGTLERIAEAKYELVAALPAGAPAVMNADDPVCLRLAERARSEGKRVLLYGIEERPGLAVRGMDDLPSFVQSERIDIGIIAVPATAAQSVADLLIISGIRGVLNMTLTHIVAPVRVAVIDSRIVASLQELTHAIKFGQ